MKNIILILSLLLSFSVFGKGKIQDQDVKSKAELVAAGATEASLINDTKIYVTGGSFNDQLSDLFAAGRIAPTALPTESAKALIATTAGVQSYAEGIANPNYIINGNFDFWQRGTSLADGVNTSTFLADRFKTIGYGSTVAKTQQLFTVGQTDVPNNPKYYARYVVTSSANAANYQASIHTIEGVRTLAGKVVTLSFYAKADAAKPIAIELGQVFAGAEPVVYTYPTTRKFNLTTSWAKYVLNITLPSISGKTITEGSDYLSIIFWMDAGSNFNTRTDSLGNQSGTFDFAQFKLEEGSVATPFVRAGGTLAGELVACQRYYTKSYNVDVAPATINTAVGMIQALARNTAELYTSGRIFPVTMRAIPTVTSYSYAGTINKASTLGGVDIGTTMSFAGIGTNGFYQAADSGSGFTAATNYIFHYTADAEL